ENGGRSIALERKSPGSHFIEDHTKGKEVRAPIQLFAESLLGRHVRHRAQGGPRASQVLGVLAEGCRVSPLPTASFDAATFASPKSRIFAWPRSVTNMFAGLISLWTISFE